MSGDRNDPYTVLGVPSTASPQEITHAFHRLVRCYHPDTHTGPQEPGDLREVIAAYHVLRDPARRADHDRRHPPPPQPVVPLRPVSAAAAPAIRVGPVRYHGPPLPTNHPNPLMWELLTDSWWW